MALINLVIANEIVYGVPPDVTNFTEGICSLGGRVGDEEEGRERNLKSSMQGPSFQGSNHLHCCAEVEMSSLLRLP